MKNGSENSQHFYENLRTTCPHCGEENSLAYRIKELEIDEDTGDTTPVEGLVCSKCDDIFMNSEEGARFLNVKAKHEGSLLYYGVHEGDIQEVRLQ